MVVFPLRFLLIKPVIAKQSSIYAYLEWNMLPLHGMKTPHAMLLTSQGKRESKHGTKMKFAIEFIPFLLSHQHRHCISLLKEGVSGQLDHESPHNHSGIRPRVRPRQR
ncbi:hypothetical protein V6N12_051985 [Hibiscus sabdariffa]|uniref:Uncharacterized protein n=1 Tax=Hibiscus sabdariffa TaxID=183260 RepID=A0ABR2GGY1_9ROSI